ncbi:aminotransferase class I/II-fold pyridoxal phosphate-dependent enzyme [Thiotrichales bacterium 19S3-11]|nr:aminotransferase class I/II-fold pyridoxal phosphate-dependent enzyme [Thiotrichales bacterium 19S3-11]
MPINNCGDPFSGSNYKLNTHEFEQNVIMFFAKLYHLHSNYWGYVTNGGTEGNLCAINIAKNIYKDGIIYYSTSSHYSVPKAINMTRSQSIMINSDASGEIDYNHLLNQLTKNQSKPAIIICNIGTTVTGAIDNLDTIKSILKKASISQSVLYSLRCCISRYDTTVSR